jgi:hypothetical protein
VPRAYPVRLSGLPGAGRHRAGVRGDRIDLGRNESLTSRGREAPRRAGSPAYEAGAVALALAAAFTACL